MNAKYLIFLFLFLAGCSSKQNSNSFSDMDNPVKGDKEVSETLNEFFEKYRDEGSSKAVDFIFGTQSGAKLDQLTELKSKLLTLSNSAGKFTGYESITTQHAGNSLIYYSYLVKHEYQPFRFIFIFYKSSNAWRIHKFKFDDQVDSELEEAGRLYFIK